MERPNFHTTHSPPKGDVAEPVKFRQANPSEIAEQIERYGKPVEEMTVEDWIVDDNRKHAEARARGENRKRLGKPEETTTAQALDGDGQVEAEVEQRRHRNPHTGRPIVLTTVTAKRPMQVERMETILQDYKSRRRGLIGAGRVRGHARRGSNTRSPRRRCASSSSSTSRGDPHLDGESDPPHLGDAARAVARDHRRAVPE